jgi:hypothetical protein
MIVPGVAIPEIMQMPCQAKRPRHRRAKRRRPSDGYGAAVQQQ